MQESTCLGCSCLCDDLIIKQEANGQFSVESECAVAQNWLSDISKGSQQYSFISGKKSETLAAIDEVAAILSNASSPLITGLKDCSSQTIRSAIQLAEKLGAYIDPMTTKSDSHRLKALNQHGGSTCTLGEVIQRADLIIFWGRSVTKSNPCLLNRLELERKTAFLPNGREDRQLISVSRDLKDQADWANESLDFSNLSSTEVLTSLAIELQKDSNSEKSSETQWTKLAEQIRNAQYPVIIFDSHLADGEEETAWNALSKFVSIANEANRIHSLSISSNHSSHMAESALSWQTGYSRCLNFASGTPEYNLDFWSTEQLVGNQEIDVCIYVGQYHDDSLGNHLEKSNSSLQSVLISPNMISESDYQWDITLASAQDGVHNLGTFLRFDHVPLPSRQFANSELLSTSEILNEIIARIK